MWSKIGKVGKASGLRGEFFLSQKSELLHADVTFLSIGETLETAQKLKVEKIHNKNSRVVVKLSGVDDRAGVDLLKHQFVWLPKDEAKVGSDEYLWSDIKGRQITSFKSNEVVGRVTTIDNFGASDIVEIVNKADQKISLPFIKQYFDMSFSNNQEPIVLLAELEDIADLWTGGRDKD